VKINVFYLSDFPISVEFILSPLVSEHMVSKFFTCEPKIISWYMISKYCTLFMMTVVNVILPGNRCMDLSA
jgi:hypothetical protein